MNANDVNQSTIEKKQSLSQSIRNALKAGLQMTPLRAPTDEHWTRVVMNRETRKFIENLGPKRLKVLEISGDQWGQWCDFGEYRAIHYPEFDICKEELDDRFDLIILEQVLEHLLQPRHALQHMYAMLNDGGYAMVTTPFLYKIHNYPVDCSRWTELGMKHLLADVGFDLDKITTGAWGNLACVKSAFRGYRKYRPLIHSLKNDPRFPVSVWAFAQK